MKDALTQRMAVVFLGLVVLTTIAGGIALALNDRTLPGELIAIGSGAGGALGGITLAGRSGDTDG